MKIVRERIGDIIVAVLQGDKLTSANSKEFKQVMAVLIEPDARVVLDVGDLQSIDSSGFGAFLSFRRQLGAAGGDVKLVSVSKPVRTLFELVGLHRVFDIYNTKEEALRAFLL